MQRSIYSLCRRLPLGLLAGALIGVAACGGGNNPGPIPPNNGPSPAMVGAVPETEFNALAVPSYALLADCSELKERTQRLWDRKN